MTGSLSTGGILSPNWHASPCSSCGESWCCTHLALLKMEVASRDDFLVLLEYLGYQDTLVGLQDNGVWTLYLNRSCRYLSDRRCRIHGSEEQPWICRRYSPHTCWYIRAFPGTAGPLLLQMNRERLLELIGMIEFNGEGKVERVPPWNDRIGRIKPIPLNLNRKFRTGEILRIPAGPLQSERDRDLLAYKCAFPGVEWDGLESLLISPIKKGRPRRTA